MDTVASISISTLRSLIGTPRAPLVVDEPAALVWVANFGALE